MALEIADKFFHLEIERIQDERARKTAEDALQLGVALLQGKNVLR